MHINRIIQITLAIVVSVAAGFFARTVNPAADTCTRAALDAVLDGGRLVLDDDCVLVVSPAAVITGDVLISGGMLHSNGVDRILTVAEGARLVLRETAILSGSIEFDPPYGGAIYNAGSVLLENSRIVANSAQQGGGIYNTGNLIVRGSVFERNRAREGGAIYNRGNLLMINSRIADNSARSDGTYGGYGAGIVNKGYAWIMRTEIVENRANGDGIGIDTSGNLIVRDSIIMGNTCAGDACRGSGVLRFDGHADVRQNYWGSPDGPGDEGTGAGDGIAGIPQERYAPFLTDLPDWAQD